MDFLTGQQGMATRTVDPAMVTTLRDWVARWPKTGNLAFDEEQRNPVIYTRAAPMTKVKEIPWKREGDTLTILSQRDSFGAAAIGAAERRMGKFREQRDTMTAAATEQIRVAEAALLDAWRAYRAAAGGRSALMRDIMVAERTLQELETAAAPAGRKIVEVTGSGSGFTGTQVPTMPLALRGMAMAEVGDTQ